MPKVNEIDRAYIKNRKAKKFYILDINAKENRTW